MNKCILVGNSSSTLNKGLGLHINSFENVIRFNRFKIKGYEIDLGTKCTHWVLNYKLTTDNRNYLVKNLSQVKSEVTGLKQALILTTAKDKGQINKIKKQVDVEVTYERFEPPFGSKPTTGFLAIKYLLNHFTKLTLVGFDFGKSNHYWGNHNASDIPGKHEWGKEKHYIDNLTKQGKIEII
tara:strand:+ start:86 stop:631 length:546 start_codon:yes stop_codon:yes gene_type:complete